MVVLSDGSPDDRSSALQAGDSIKREGIRIIAIGVGQADHKFMRRLASDPSESIATTLDELSNTFGRIARSLGSQTSTGLLRIGKEP